MGSTGKTSRKSKAKKSAVTASQLPGWASRSVPALAKGGSWVAIAWFVLGKIDLGGWDKLIRKAFQELMRNNGPGPVLLGIFIVGVLSLIVLGAGAVFRHMQAEIHRQVDEKKWLQERLIGRAPSSSEDTGGET